MQTFNNKLPGCKSSKVLISCIPDEVNTQSEDISTKASVATEHTEETRLQQGCFSPLNVSSPEHTDINIHPIQRAMLPSSQLVGRMV